MDTLAHGLFGAAIVAPKGSEKLMVAAGVAGMLPDLIVQGAVIVERGVSTGFKIMGGGGEDFPANLLVLYRATHSLFVPAFLWLVLPKKWRILALPYLLHVLFDIFTHCGLFGTRIFFPLSDFHVCGINYAASEWAWEINYGLLVGIYFLIYWKFYRPYLRR
ncbi:hypothetical protein HY440_02500 [Candidatus Microgenomates bacterium]|nr:hypothetical protein [Candidatus Microgenomates bacterium]